MTNKANNTPLHLACYRNNEDIVKLLLKHPKIDLFVKNKGNHTPIFYTLSRPNRKLFNLFMDAYTDKKLTEDCYAVCMGNRQFSLFQELMMKYKPEETIVQNILHRAMELGRFQFAKYLLLEHGAVPNNDTYGIPSENIFLHSRVTEQELLELLPLLEKYTIYLQLLVIYAVMLGYSKLLQKLLSFHHIPLTGDDNTCYYFLPGKSQPQSVKTILDVAIAVPHAEVIIMLLQSGRSDLFINTEYHLCELFSQPEFKGEDACVDALLNLSDFNESKMVRKYC